MQIRGDYGYHYQSSSDAHTHHVTKCLQEDAERKQEGGAAGVKTQAGDKAEQTAADSAELTGAFGTQTDTVSSKKKPGFFKEFWDSMGEEASQTKKDGLREDAFSGKEGTGRGLLPAVYGALTGWREAITGGIRHTAENVRQRIRTEAAAFLKKFKRGEEAFGALTDAEARSGRKKNGTPDKKSSFSERGKTSGREQEIPSASGVENHLLDSYTKKGEYCRLGDTFKS